MLKFLLVTAAVAVAMILPVMALAENHQFNPEQNTSVVGGSNSSTVKEPEGSTVKEPEGAANESKVPETGKPIVSAEDAAVTERLQDLVEKKRCHSMQKVYRLLAARKQFAGADPKRCKVALAVETIDASAILCSRHVLLDAGLDPKDYPTPRFVDTDPSRLAADELTLTNSIAVFVRHASTGRVAFTRVSAAIDSELKAPAPNTCLDQSPRARTFAPPSICITRTSRNEALKAELASARATAPSERRAWYRCA